MEVLPMYDHISIAVPVDGLWTKTDIDVTAKEMGFKNRNQFIIAAIDMMMGYADDPTQSLPKCFDGDAEDDVFMLSSSAKILRIIRYLQDNSAEVDGQTIIRDVLDIAYGDR